MMAYTDVDTETPDSSSSEDEFPSTDFFHEDEPATGVEVIGEVADTTSEALDDIAAMPEEPAVDVETLDIDQTMAEVEEEAILSTTSVATPAAPRRRGRPRRNTNKEETMPRGRAPRRTTRGRVETASAPAHTTVTRRVGRTPTTVSASASAARRPKYNADEQESLLRTALQKEQLGMNSQQAAAEIGVSYPTLLRWKKAAGIEVVRGRRPNNAPRVARVAAPRGTVSRAVSSLPTARPRAASQVEASRATRQTASGIHLDVRAFVRDNEDLLLQTILEDKPPAIQRAIKNLLAD